MHLGKVLGLFLASAVAGMMGSSSANALSCPGSIGSTNGSAQYALSGSGGCAYGTGQLNGNSSDTAQVTAVIGNYPVSSGYPIPGGPEFPIGSNYVLLDTVGPSGDLGGLVPGVLNLTFTGNPGTQYSSGTWTITNLPSIYTDLLLALVDSNNTPSWAVFSLSALTGTWESDQNLCKKGVCTNGQLNLSKAMLFADPPAQVPLPPSLVLFGSALLGLSAMARRKRKARLQQP